MDEAEMRQLLMAFKDTVLKADDLVSVPNRQWIYREFSWLRTATLDSTVSNQFPQLAQWLLLATTTAGC
jgi:hypothetical protein